MKSKILQKLTKSKKVNPNELNSATSLCIAWKSSLLKVVPKTGRPHQIRVQMKAMNCPIRGDLKYGYSKPNQDKSIDLHAFKLDFIHPVKKEPISVISKPKWPDFKAFINELD